MKDILVTIDNFSLVIIAFTIVNVSFIKFKIMESLLLNLQVFFKESLLFDIKLNIGVFAMGFLVEPIIYLLKRSYHFMIKQD